MSTEEQEVNDITKEHVLITTSATPTVGGGTAYTVYLDKSIDRPAKYRNLIEFLDKAKEDDEFVLKMNGPGGYLDTCAQLIHSIQSTEATVLGELVGEICSAHANIFVACHAHLVHPYAAMMVHTLSGGAWGKGEDIIRMGTASNDIAKLMYTDLYDGFLTDEELEDVLTNNKDLWFVGAENINARLADLHLLRDTAVEALQAETLKEAQDEIIETAAAIVAQRSTSTVEPTNAPCEEQHGGIIDDVLINIDLSLLENVEDCTGRP